MVACPHCHIYKGMFSDMKKVEKGVFSCPANVAHRFTRDREGNFHQVKA